MADYEFRFNRKQPAIWHESILEAQDDPEAYEAASSEIAEKYGSEALNGHAGINYTRIVMRWRS